MSNRHAMLVGLLAGAGLLAGCRLGTGVRERLAGKEAPDFTLKSLDGANVRLSSFRGKPVMLAYWAVG